jgi:hypothetical protein
MRDGGAGAAINWGAIEGDSVPVHAAVLGLRALTRICRPDVPGGRSNSRRWPGGTLEYDSAMSRALLSVLVAVWAAHAGAWHSGNPGAPNAMYAQVAGDPGSAARQAAAMTGGRVLDVQTVAAGGTPR